MPWDMSSLNISGTLNIFRVLVQPGLCLPHVTLSTFNDLPVPLNTAFARYGGSGKKAGPNVDIKAIVLDKDDCFAKPGENEVFKDYKSHFAHLRATYPGPRLLIVSNTAGSSADPILAQSRALSAATGVAVLSHTTKKPSCGPEIMAYFSAQDETRDIRPDQIAVVGDRLLTDMCLANRMGAWGVWVQDGVLEMRQKSIIARLEQRVADFLLRRGYAPPIPKSSFEDCFTP